MQDNEPNQMQQDMQGNPGANMGQQQDQMMSQQ